MSTSPLGNTFGARLSAYLTASDEFRKYRKGLNKHALKLRHDLNIVTRDTKNYKDNEQTSSISAEKYNADSRYGLLLLLLAERDTVHALEIKNLLEVSGERMSSYKKLMVSKLKKAASTCTKLLTVVSDEQNQQTKLEFYIYAALIHGLYAVNKKRWTEALYCFSVARCGLEFLNSQVSDDVLSDASVSNALISEILDVLVDPSLNLAVSQDTTTEATVDLRTIARKHCHDDTLPFLKPLVDIIKSIDSSFVEPLAEEEIPNIVTWRDHQATIYNDELALKLFRVNKQDWKQFKESNDFDLLYSQWSNLVEIHAGDLAKQKDEDDVEKVQDGAILQTYLKYNLLFTRVKRDTLNIEKLEAQSATSATKLLHSNKDIARLYSSVLATIEELRDLPGVYNDEDLDESLKQMSQYFAVKRDVTIGESYAVANKLPEALKVFLSVKETFTPSATFYRIDEFPYNVTSNAQASDLAEQISTRLAKIHTLAQLHLESSGSHTSYVSDNVFRFPSTSDQLSKIINVNQKGAIAPVLSKPVLFDVAFNYIGYSDGKSVPDVQPEAKISSDEEKKKGGFFGIFGRS